MGSPCLADQALILDQAYAEDASGNLTFAQARSLALTPFTGTLLKGYTQSAIWVRVRMAKPENASAVYLIVEPQFLDDVSLYDAGRPDAPPVISGDQWPNAEMETLWHGNSFTLRQGGTRQEYWLKIRSTSTMVIQLNAILHDDLHVKADRADSIQATYTGILVAILIWAAGVLISRRGDQVILAFFMQQLSSFLQAMSYFGHFRNWFSGWEHVGIFNFTTSFFIISTTATTVWFHHALLATSRPDGARLRLLVLARLPIAASFALFFLGHVQMALQLNMIMVTAVPFILLAVAASIGQGPARPGMPSLPRKTMVIFYLLILTLMSWIGLSVLGALQIGFFVDYRIVTLLSVALVIAVLSWRARRLDRMKLRVMLRNRQLRQRLNHRRQKMEEQSQLMSMLSHELKTPLSILRLATAMSLRSAPLQEHAEKAILNISAIIDRCVKVTELEAADSTIVVPAPCDVSQELEDLRAQKNSSRILISGSSPSGFATDKALLRILAGNLMENALKYGDPDAPVKILIKPELRKINPGVAIEFINAPGRAGFPDTEKLFEKFYRAPGAQRESGAGLGLYIVKGVSKMLGGTIKYSPTPKRIRFKLWLPPLA